MPLTVLRRIGPVICNTRAVTLARLEPYTVPYRSSTRAVMQFHGIIPPAVTPMTASEDIDLPRLRATLDRLLAAGVHGLFVLGTTGEFYALGPAEKQAI